MTAELEAVGILPRSPGVGRDRLIRVVPVIAATAAASAHEPDQRALSAIARALDECGLPFGAARAHVRAGDWSAAIRLVAEHGDAMLRQGAAADVVQLVESAPVRTEAVRVIHADALRICGDLDGATRAFRPLVAEADDPSGHGWTPALATRVAAVHYASGRLESALDVLGQVEGDRDRDDPATVEWLSSRVHVLCSLGRGAEAAADAATALALGESSGDPRALASAHLAMGRISSGGTREAHHQTALKSAADCGDVIISSRILVNHAFQLLAGARYDEARQAAEAALQAADVGIATGRRAAALHNLAEALMQQGDYDEASWHLSRAVALCRRLGVGRTALGLLGLAEIHRHLGQDARARTRYLHAVELARQTSEPQILVPALAGLARLDALSPDRTDDRLDRARDAADEAMRAAETSTSLLPFALTAAGWVAISRSEPDRASRLAEESVAAARELHALDLLADALELAAAAASDPDRARELLLEAWSIWEPGGAGPPARRIELQLGRLEGADSTARSRAREAARELQRLGVRHVNGVPVATAGAGAPVEVDVLGGFRVLVDRTDVPIPAWRSKQARTLVKILAARRGRPATRPWLCETLWPGDDPAKTGHRLSVLLATVRGVLDPDKRWPTDRFIAADPGGIRLDLRHVAVDAETLIRDAAVAAELMDAGQLERAGEILADVDGRYRGDAFEDECGEDWSDGLREEVRAAWQRSVRRLAALARKAGRVGDAQTYLVRLLAADRYDEKVHELLVKSLLSSGRRGEARRAFERWRDAMADIGAPEPDPSLLGHVVTPY